MLHVMELDGVEKMDKLKKLSDWHDRNHDTVMRVLALVSAVLALIKGDTATVWVCIIGLWIVGKIDDAPVVRFEVKRHD